MTRRTFQHGTETEQKFNVLTWRLPKPQAAPKQPVPKRENVKKPGPVFGRRTAPPAG